MSRSTLVVVGVAVAVPSLAAATATAQLAPSAQPAQAMPAVRSLPGAQATRSLPDTGQETAAPTGSVSCGSANRGALAGGVRLPAKGVGYVTPQPWLSRGLRYGTAELIALVERAARTVAAEDPGAVLAVADLSRKGGGPVPDHRSHQSGRDVDLIYYAVGANGKPFPPDDNMPYYTHSGLAYYAKSPVWRRRIPRRYFDRARNWALIKALLTDPQAHVTRIFVSHRIKRWLIRYAETAGEPAALIKRARHVLEQPSNAESHDDHMHVRIACPVEDIVLGHCRNHLARHRRRGRWHTHVRCPARQPAEIAGPAPTRSR